MKDRQIKRKAEGAHIPLISPVLHLIAIPVLVILRRNFGYLFLRPKSIFLSLCWAFCLFAVYSFFEPRRWSKNAFFWWFCAFSVCLYVFHLSRSVYAQFKKAPHDFFGGTPWLSLLCKDKSVVPLWIEPGFVLLTSLSLRFIFGRNHLSTFLLVAAFALLTKEAINQWAKLRKIKHQLDATEDAEETMEIVAEEREPKSRSSAPVKTTRKARVQRSRATLEAEKNIEYHAAILRMIPPYSLEQAEENFQKLVKQLHPDRTDIETGGDSDGITFLVEAREFFRCNHEN